MKLTKDELYLLIACSYGYYKVNAPAIRGLVDHQAIIQRLQKHGLVTIGTTHEDAEWNLTSNGQKLFDSILQHAAWKQVFTPV